MAIETLRLGALEYLAAQSISVPHCFTTRLGGVSQGHLASMNLAVSRGDSRENVVRNFEILGQALGFAPEDTVMTHQTHTDIVRRVTEADRGTGLFKPGFPDCDALITDTPGLALVVFSADCTPILFCDPVTGAVGAAHAGWRGTAADIAGKTVKAMGEAFGCRAEDIRCAIGPNIGSCCFQTDADVPDAMVAALGEAALPHIRREGQKYHLDLKQINALFLKRAGIRHLEINDVCSACDPARFWSHRRNGPLRGSQGAVILCKEVSK